MVKHEKTSKIRPISEKAEAKQIPNNGSEKVPVELSTKPYLQKSLWEDTTTKQKLMLFYIVMGQFSSFFCASIPAPFLARVVLAKGGEVVYSTVILQVMIFVMAFSSAAFGKYQSTIGCKRVLFCGVLCFATCQILFGTLTYTKDIYVFLGLGIVLRIIQGIGQGAYAVASLTIICQEFSDHVGKVFGIAESAVGIGYLMGPLLGSLLFSWSKDMLLPFVASGVVILLSCPVGIVLLRNFTKDGRDMSKMNVTKYICNFRSFMTLGCAASVYGVLGIFDVTSTVYLQTRGFSVTQVGFLMFTSAVAYFLSCIVSGYVTSIGKIIRWTIFALALTGVAFNSFLFGSSLPTFMMYVAAVLLGMFSACALVSGFNELINLAIDGRPDMKSNFNLHSALSGAWNFVLGFGTFIFPTAGSFVENELSFSSSMIISFFIGISCTLLLSSLVHISTTCCNEMTASKQEEEINLLTSGQNHD